MTSGIDSIGNVSPARTCPFLNHVMVGFGLPVAMHDNEAFLPSRALVSVGCCVNTGTLGCGGAVGSRKVRFGVKTLSVVETVCVCHY